MNKLSPLIAALAGFGLLHADKVTFRNRPPSDPNSAASREAIAAAEAKRARKAQKRKGQP